MLPSPLPTPVTPGEYPKAAPPGPWAPSPHPHPHAYLRQLQEGVQVAVQPVLPVALHVGPAARQRQHLLVVQQPHQVGGAAAGGGRGAEGGRGRSKRRGLQRLAGLHVAMPDMGCVHRTDRTDCRRTSSALSPRPVCWPLLPPPRPRPLPVSPRRRAPVRARVQHQRHVGAEGGDARAGEGPGLVLGNVQGRTEAGSEKGSCKEERTTRSVHAKLRSRRWWFSVGVAKRTHARGFYMGSAA